ncbi:MAG: helix-turn-helix domain-containing protein [Micrococcales bacterium]|nr:helix-turn-helix domain-containing protein [Micrococcales bacterium]
MAVKFRNLTGNSDWPVGKWGVEGLLAVIERGAIDDWRIITCAVRRDPNGQISADLEEALDLAEGRGGASLVARALADSKVGPGATVARRMRHDVRRTGLSLRQFAALLGTSHSRLSTYLSGQVTPSAAIAVKSARIGDEYRV